MDTTKLKEALAELQNQRNLLDAAIKNIQNVLAMLVEATTSPREKERVARGKASYIEDAVAIYELAGKPMHMKDLIVSMSERRGKKIPRASLESSIIRHIAGLGQRARLAKFGPSTFGLSIWKQPSLAKTA